MIAALVTVFKTGYFSNGYLPIVFLCALAGLFVALFVWFKWESNGTRSLSKAKTIFLMFWIPVWLIVFVLPLGVLISDGYRYTRALSHGRCSYVEGPVRLIRQQPKSEPRLWLLTPRHATFTMPGEYALPSLHSLTPPATNDPGDVVKIGDRLFLLNFYSLGLGYQQTAAHGGVLINGAYVQLHYVGNTIVKVEVRE